MEGDEQSAQDARVENLWQVLDTRKEGQLNLSALKRGLNKIDHRKRCNTILTTAPNMHDSPQERGLPP